MPKQRGRARNTAAAGTEAHGRRRGRTVALGGAVLALAACALLAAVGLLGVGAVRFVRSLMGPGATPAYFQSYLAPVVMFDPRPFASLSQAGDDWKLETAVWAALETGEAGGQYAVADDGREILPVRDVAAGLKQYFGIVTPSYHTFTADGSTYEYDAKNACFYVPLTEVDTYYLPRVRKVSHSFGTIVLVVEYIKAHDWGQGEQSLTGAADKTVEVTLARVSGGYRLRALRAYTPPASGKGT